MHFLNLIDILLSSLLIKEGSFVVKWSTTADVNFIGIIKEKNVSLSGSMDFNLEIKCDWR